MSDQPKSSNHADKKKDYTSPEWWMIYLTGVLVLVTACLAWYTAGLFRETKKLADDAQENSIRQAGEMQDSLKISRDAASATEKSAMATQRTMEIMGAVEAAQLRFTVSPIITSGPSDTALVEWKPVLTNIGRTIASEIIVTGTTLEIIGAHGAYAEPPTIRDPIAVPHPNGASLAPGEQLPLRFSVQIPNWDKVLNRETSCIVHIEVSYRDTFGRARVFRKCFYYEHRGNNFRPCPITSQSQQQPQEDKPAPS